MRIFFYLCLVTLNACSTEYSRHTLRGALTDLGLMDEVSYTRQADWVLHSSSKILLLEPEINLAGQDQRLNHRTHAAMRDALMHSFRKHFPSSRSSTHSLASVTTHSFVSSDYIVGARLFHVQDNLNTRAELHEGRGLHKGRHYGRDEIDIQLQIFDARSRRLLDSIALSARAAFLVRDDRLPADVIQPSMDKLVAALAGNEALKQL